VRYLDDMRPAAASGEVGPSSPRDRPVDLEVATGSLGCGDLLYELKAQFARVEPAQTVRVVSNDPGARTEIPAWCRSTGKDLMAQDHPYYVIRVRSNDVRTHAAQADGGGEDGG
jgi:tRNA 2-thiouridine synthesizing protein A